MANDVDGIKTCSITASSVTKLKFSIENILSPSFGRTSNGNPLVNGNNVNTNNNNGSLKLFRNGTGERRPSDSDPLDVGESKPKKARCSFDISSLTGKRKHSSDSESSTTSSNFSTISKDSFNIITTTTTKNHHNRHHLTGSNNNNNNNHHHHSHHHNNNSRTHHHNNNHHHHHQRPKLSSPSSPVLSPISSTNSKTSPFSSTAAADTTSNDSSIPKENTNSSSNKGNSNGENGPNGLPPWVPAWVYCTRYSDRPSSGPRSRRMKKREKKPDEKRPRTAFTAEQLARLKQEFNDNRYLTEKRRKDLADDLKLNESQIKIWFQNKRAKIKKANGQKNRLASMLMAQGLYNHSTVSVHTEDVDYVDDDSDEDRESNSVCSEPSVKK